MVTPLSTDPSRKVKKTCRSKLNHDRSRNALLHRSPRNCQSWTTSKLGRARSTGAVVYMMRHSRETTCCATAELATVLSLAMLETSRDDTL